MKRVLPELLHYIFLISLIEEILFKDFFLFSALVAILLSPNRNFCTVVEKDIIRNICVKLFRIWTKRSGDVVARIFFSIFSYDGFFVRWS